jgi:tetratricopeptide (TPR) repeat protein
MNPVIRDAAIVCGFAFTFGATRVAAQRTSGAEPLDRAQVAAWRDDLTYMAREMGRRHKNLYHTVSRARFDSAITALSRRVPSLERHQIIVEMARIVALVGDGHTNIAPTRDPKIGFHTLPIQLYFFKDGLFVRAADRAYADLSGARVVRIGPAAPEEAYRRVRDIIGRDNEMGARFFAPFLLAMPEVLHALGLSSHVDRATFVMERGGRRSTVNLPAHGPIPMMPSDTDVSWWPDRGWIDMRRSEETAPLWLKEDPRNYYWFEYLPQSKLVYLQFNKVGDKEGANQESLSQFSGRLLAFLDSARVEKLVLDLRLNRGGDGTLNRPLLVSLIKARQLDGPGKLFVIIGRSTFSAAQFLVNELERYTDAVFVGEPSGGKVNSYGDSRKITLPNSGITVRVSTLWWQEDPRDRRHWKAPDIAAELGAADYRSNVDPALKVVLNYREESSVAERMAEALARQDVQEAVRRYRAYRSDPRFVYAETENEINSLGYLLLEQKRLGDAIAIFELNAAEHPTSANVYDSLGEAYLLAGRRQLAIRNYRKSLRLDPTNENARAVLEKLGG